MSSFIQQIIEATTNLRKKVLTLFSLKVLFTLLILIKAATCIQVLNNPRPNKVLWAIYFLQIEFA